MNEIANPGSHFNREYDCFVRRPAGQGNRNFALPNTQSPIRIPQGKRADGSGHARRDERNPFPEFILGWMILLSLPAYTLDESGSIPQPKGCGNDPLGLR